MVKSRKIKNLIKCRDQACGVESPPLKNYKDFTMKLKVKYIFPTSTSGAKFYNYQLPEGLGVRKMLAHGIRMLKNSKTREDSFGFSRIFIELCGSKVQLALPHRKFINSAANLEIAYM